MDNLEFLRTFGGISLDAAYDVERDSPEIHARLTEEMPQLPAVVDALRLSVPLVGDCRVGGSGGAGFYRLPNHYRSVSLVLPSGNINSEKHLSGVLVFKGTEPLVSDFPSYLDWMMNAPFRSSPLPLGLHFPLDLRLPPGAMWIEECLAEQRMSTEVQGKYLSACSNFARLPLPLFVFKMSIDQNRRYDEAVRSKLPRVAYDRVKGKIGDGLGVEVYYYPDLPVRAADLLMAGVREVFGAATAGHGSQRIPGKWVKLLAEILGLGYMPYVPWHHGMGACVDPGNASVDGGFHDLLTLAPFDAIPTEHLFASSLQATIKLLAETEIVLAAATLGDAPIFEHDVLDVAMEHISREVRTEVHNLVGAGWSIDEKLWRCVQSANFDDVVSRLAVRHSLRRRGSQYISLAKGDPQASTYPKAIGA